MRNLTRPARLFLVGLSFLALSAQGCQGIDRREATSPVTEEIAAKSAEKKASGALLRTGAFQLGQGVSCDLLRSQGDGLSGFPVK